ncbi:hypothetical protein KCP70_24745 [Salmonella enterica subsp. enterica]|nr:hypothetical protein KCP70_24745 [Salmonella enterica subsp. enterica]
MATSAYWKTASICTIATYKVSIALMRVAEEGGIDLKKYDDSDLPRNRTDYGAATTKGANSCLQIEIGMDYYLRLISN